MNYKLERNLDKLSACLGVATNKKRGSAWAGECCLLSRYIHSDVWEYGTGHKDVMAIIVLLDKAHAGIEKLVKDRRFTVKKRKTMAVYERNVRLRTNNLRNNRLNNRCSNVIPNDDLMNVNLVKTA